MTAPFRHGTASLLAVYAAGILSIGVLAAGVLLAEPAGPVMFAAYAGTGLVLAARRPRQPIAWLLALIGVGLLLGSVRVVGSPAAITAGATAPLEAFTVWANGTGWAIAFVGLTGLALVFPTGALPSGPGRPISLLWLTASVAICVLIAVAPVAAVTLPDGTSAVDVPNPLAALPDAAIWTQVPDPGTMFSFQFALFATSLVALFVRFRHSSGVERLQYRWLVSAIVLVAIGTAMWAVGTFILLLDEPLLVALASLIAYPSVPLAVGVAVLRYRLYDIDRLVSRTVGWGLASAAIVGVFGLGVLGLGALLSGFGQGQAIATAGATLLAFALFQPLRSRLQRLVDRRFDRPRIEAERTIERHGERLAHEVELDVIERGVVDTVAATMRPSSTTLWIRTVR